MSDKLRVTYKVNKGGLHIVGEDNKPKAKSSKKLKGGENVHIDTKASNSSKS